MEHPSNERHGAQEPDNAGLLDEIETLLQELSSEHGPAVASGAPAGGPARDDDPKPKMPHGPSLSVSAGYDLAKPVDYPADAARYDYRRASQGPQAEVAIQSMARKLAPDRNADPDKPLRPQHPQAAAPQQHVSDGFRAPIGGSATGVEPLMAEQDDDEAERLNQRRRRLRLRPARRVPGSRPEAQFATFPAMDQTPDSEWDPRMARNAVVRNSGTWSGLIGAGAMLLIVASAAGAFTFIEPLNRLLPGSGPDQEGPAIEVADSDQTGARFDLASGTGGAGDQPELQKAAPDATDTAPVADTRPSETALAASAERGAVDTGGGSSGLQPAIPVGTGSSRDKSPERLDQDSVIQARLQDQQKKALEISNTGAKEDAATDSDPIKTGSIGQPAADEQIRGANAVARQASASHAGRVSKRTLETEETVKVAGLAPNAPFGVIQGEARIPSGTADVAPQPRQEPQQQLARTENTDLNSVDVNRTVPGASNSAGNSAAPLHGSNVDTLLTRGHELLNQGDIASARMLFQRVVAMGDSRGAKGMGMTYDPRVFEGLPVVGIAADIEQAEYWYQKAREFSAAKQTPDVSETDRMPASGN